MIDRNSHFNKKRERESKFGCHAFVRKASRIQKMSTLFFPERPVIDFYYFKFYVKTKKTHMKCQLPQS